MLPIALNVPCVHVEERFYGIRHSSTSLHKLVFPTTRISFLHLSSAPTDGIALHHCFHASMLLSCLPTVASSWLFNHGERSVQPPIQVVLEPTTVSLDTVVDDIRFSSFRHEDRSGHSSSRRWPWRLRHALSWPRRRSKMHVFLSWRREKVLGVVVFVVLRTVRRKTHRGGRRT